MVIKLLFTIVYFTIGITLTIWELKYRYRWGGRENLKTGLYITCLSLMIILFWPFLSIYSAFK